MFCTKCGTELNEGAAFCSKCGTKAGFSTEGQDTMNQQNETRAIPTQVIVMPTGTGPLVMGILGLFGGFIPIVKYITGLLSLLAIFIGASQRKKLKGAGLPTGKATAGIVLGTIAILITVITIAFSAMIVGSLLSGGRSSERTSRINFFTNNLPKEIQNTVWSNGSENIEFGKNKIKLNNDWYSVKKIEKGKQYTNSMFTWVYFANRHITLQQTLGRGLRLVGFMTLAEVEEERLEKERIANEIKGEWKGNIRWVDGVRIIDKAPWVENNIITAVLTLYINVDGDRITGRFTLGSVSSGIIRGMGGIDIEHKNNGEYDISKIKYREYNIRSNSVSGEVFNTNAYIKDYINLTGKMVNDTWVGTGEICMAGRKNSDFSLERVKD